MLTWRQLVFHTSLSHRPRHAIVSEVEWFNIFNFNIRSLSHVDLFLLTPRTPGDQSLIRREIISWSTLKVEQLKIKEPCVKILSCGHLCKKQPYHLKVTLQETSQPHRYRCGYRKAKWQKHKKGLRRLLGEFQWTKMNWDELKVN